MDTRHMKQLVHFLRRNFDITKEEYIPEIFDDYLQDYLTEEILRCIDDEEIIDRLRKGAKNDTEKRF